MPVQETPDMRRVVIIVVQGARRSRGGARAGAREGAGEEQVQKQIGMKQVMAWLGH